MFFNYHQFVDYSIVYFLQLYSLLFKFSYFSDRLAKKNQRMIMR